MKSRFDARADRLLTISAVTALRHAAALEGLEPEVTMQRDATVVRIMIEWRANATLAGRLAAVVAGDAMECARIDLLLFYEGHQGRGHYTRVAPALARWAAAHGVRHLTASAGGRSHAIFTRTGFQATEAHGIYASAASLGLRMGDSERAGEATRRARVIPGVSS